MSSELETLKIEFEQMRLNMEEWKAKYNFMMDSAQQNARERDDLDEACKLLNDMHAQACLERDAAVRKRDDVKVKYMEMKDRLTAENERLREALGMVDAVGMLEPYAKIVREALEK